MTLNRMCLCVTDLFVLE